jgi:tetrapyrrole methylase family protein/MazG family protein/ATP diphosphatase
MPEPEADKKSKLATGESVERLAKIMTILRSPDGCPWDAAQTPESLKPYIIEEAYETLDAIDLNDPEAIRDELGDLLLQIIFQARIFEERGKFSLADVATAIADKLVRRHPHVFAGTPAGDSRMLADQWETIKASEKRRRGKSASSVSDIPRHLPALQKARKLIEKTGTELHDSLAKDLLSEASELLAGFAGEVHRAGGPSRETQFGELLFTLTKLGHLWNIDAEQALRKTNDEVIADYNAKLKADQIED